MQVLYRKHFFPSVTSANEGTSSQDAKINRYPMVPQVLSLFIEHQINPQCCCLCRAWIYHRDTGKGVITCCTAVGRVDHICAGTKYKLQQVFCTQQEEVKPGAAAEPDAELQLPDRPQPPGTDHVPANQTDTLQVCSLHAYNHF